MALLFCDGFDLYASQANLSNRGWIVSTGTGSTVSLVAGRYGGRAVSLLGAVAGGGVTSIFKSWVGLPQTVVAALALSVQVGFSTFSTTILRLRDGTNVQLAVQTEPDGRLTVLRGATVLATSANVLSPSTWAWIEFRATIDPAAGAYELRVNGVVWLSATGINTRATANSYATNLSITAPASITMLVDDCVVMDTTGATLNGFIGDVRIETLMPAGDVAIQWTPSGAGTNAAQINEAQLNTTNYVSSSTPGQVDTYTLANLSSVPATVHGVNVVWSASKSDAGARQARSHVVQGATTANGATKDLGTGPLYYEDLFLTDPATAAAWDGAGVNAANLGLELVA